MLTGRPQPGLSVARLVEHYPRLYHASAAGSWPSLQRHGLLPTTHLVETAELPAERRHELLTRRRTATVELDHPRYGRVVLRDQLPLRPELLSPKLVGVTFEQWLGLLNERVFFWLHPRRLAGLLSARICRDRPFDVLTLDTASLVAAHRERVRLSPINSGSALYPNAAVRGPGTFARIEDYPWAERRRTRPVADAVAELAVIGGVPDLTEHVIAVDRYLGPALTGRLWPEGSLPADPAIG
ncbi:hypothetical protein FHX74_001546 [Friedmanniella endophytica]|uniref:Uncharacterized protein n=1 Tax=Microlunatus kandeliicorticis TaxID=1759536 RepID=A0A7W3IRL0_9ACTN|nr:hypothetical protein [Microlunatus kandeliicorticis]MBA8793941.1 hypothetical protein [Microlunatus kandeliicorticis]